MFLVWIGDLASARAGWRLSRAAVAVALLLSAIEVIQIHLPGRVAEITDPLLALLLAMVLGLSERWQSLPSDSLARAEPQRKSSCLDETGPLVQRTHLPFIWSPVQ
jgi:hypothetical protein